MYLSQYRGSWVWFTPPQVAISSECAVKVSRLDAPYEPSLDRTFHPSFTILLDFLLHKHMHMMAFATFAGCPRCPARRAGTAVYFCVFILIPHTSLCLMPWMEFFGLFDLNRQSKSNKLGDVLTFLHFVPQVSNLSALLSFNNVISVLHLGPADHEAARKDFPILAELQQSNNNVKALVWFCKLIEAFFADPFTASPIVDEEEGFAENPIQLASVLLLFLRSRKPKHSEATMTRFCDFLYLSVTWYVAWLQALDRPYWKHFMTAFGSKHLNVRSYRFTWWLGILIARGAVNQLFCK